MRNVVEPKEQSVEQGPWETLVGAGEEKTHQLKTGRVIKYYVYLDIYIYIYIQRIIIKTFT
jgi:hypothetical protein